jgi:hypothetical protein
MAFRDSVRLLFNGELLPTQDLSGTTMHSDCIGINRTERFSLDVENVLRDAWNHPHWVWFPEGQINTTYNAIDRHVQGGNSQALYTLWDEPSRQEKKSFTSSQLVEV